MADKKNKDNIQKDSNEHVDIEFTQVPNTVTKSNMDINSNVGSFTKVKNEAKKPTKEDSSIVTSVEDKKGKQDIKIDFEKFEQKKKTPKSNNRFAKLEIIISKKGNLLKIWLIIIAIIIAIIAIQIPLLIVSNSVIDNSVGANRYGWVAPSVKAGNILAIISMSLPAISFLYLLTTWIVGTNGVYKSKNFLAILLMSLCLSVTLLIVVCGLYGAVICNFNLFWNYLIYN